MIRPKITIFKAFQLNEKGNFRYYSPITGPKTLKSERIPAVFDLNKEYSKYVNLFYIKTEKQLCRYIFNRWGEGIYRIVAFVKGRQGCFTFWRGEITDSGFIFTKRQSSGVRKIESLKKEIENTVVDEDKQILQDEIDFEREMSGFDKPTKYGFKPYLIQSSRRGQFMMWEDKELSEDKQLETEQIEEIPEIKKIKTEGEIWPNDN